MKTSYKINQVILKAICFPRPCKGKSVFDVETLHTENIGLKYYRGTVIFKFSDITLHVTHGGYLTFHLLRDIKYYLQKKEILIHSVLNKFRPYCIHKITRVHLKISNIQCSFKLNFGLRYHALCLKLTRLQNDYDIFVKESRSIEFSWVRYSANLVHIWNLIKFVRKAGEATFIIDQSLCGSGIYSECTLISDFLDKVEEIVYSES